MTPTVNKDFQPKGRPLYDPEFVRTYAVGSGYNGAAHETTYPYVSANSLENSQDFQQGSENSRKPIRVLVACEFSGIVRDAFIAAGHDAYSCDMLPTEADGPHLCGDVIGWINAGWDLMIAHPPCTYLSNSGVRWLKDDDWRWKDMADAAEFFRMLLNCAIPRIAIENPIPHGHAVDRIGRKYDQIIRPWQFGHEELKATCLWLKNLPRLRPTEYVGPPPSSTKEPLRYRQWAKCHMERPGPNRKKNRSRTLAGIAEAMASQWGVFASEASV